jgi:hypothetical protein
MKMRWPKVRLFLLSGFSVLLLPLSAGALEIKFCIPACDTDPAPAIVGPGTPLTDAGVTTNSIPIASFVHTSGAVAFTVNATVSSQQSATLQKITFNPTTITANTGSACSTSSPCRMEVIATSDQLDFPAEKPAGGYPAGVFMMGSFTGPQAASPNGDAIAMTAEASGVRLLSTETDTGSGIEPVSTDVINATPGTDPGNTGASLPSGCTGNPGCKFIATALRKAFSTQITETVQQECAEGATSCLTRLRTRFTVEIKTAGNRVSLPLEHITTNEIPPDPQDPGAPPPNPTEQLVFGIAAPFSDIEVNSLTIGVNGFALTAKLKLDAGATLDPSADEVYFRVGDFSTTLVPGSYKTMAQGRLFLFAGRLDGREILTTFTRDRMDVALWHFAAAVQGIQLTGVPQPPLQAVVEVGVGGQTGSDLVTATFRQSVK